jgi:hypothetical protein
MATWEDVRRIAAELPEAVEGAGSDGNLGWSVRGKGFVWERPLRPKDIAALGDAVPVGPILCVRTPGVAAKETLVADDPAVYFTTPHFNGYPAVLVRLDAIPADELAGLIMEAWLAQVPKRLATSYLADRDRR